MSAQRHETQPREQAVPDQELTEPNATRQGTRYRPHPLIMLRDAIFERAAISPSDRVVDLGAGTGLMTVLAASVAMRVWAVEGKPQLCGYLRAKLAGAKLINVHVVESSMVRLPLGDESASIALGCYSFDHLADDERCTALRELHRVIAPGGRVVLGEPMSSISTADPGRSGFGRITRALVRKNRAAVSRRGRNELSTGARLSADPTTPAWWHDALADVGFIEISVESVAEDSGVICARKPKK